MKVSSTCAAALLLLAACSKAPPPGGGQQQQAADPSLAAPDIDASRPAGNNDLVPLAPPTPPGQESKTPLKPLPVGPGPDR